MERKANKREGFRNLIEMMGQSNIPMSSPNAAPEITVKEESGTEYPSMYHVIMLNDDYTPVDFVTDILEKTFHMTPLEARSITLKVHHEGQGSCGIYTLDVAETKVLKVMANAQQFNYPLKCIIRKESRYAIKKS